MDYKLEVITLPVTDVDQAAAFYTQKAGFVLDVDYHPSNDFRVVQLTPPGSARVTYLAVTDIEAARHDLTRRGLVVSAIRHKSRIDDWKGDWQPGTDPERRDYASLADFTDPDGNTWVIQEIGFHSSKP